MKDLEMNALLTYVGFGFIVASTLVSYGTTTDSTVLWAVYMCCGTALLCARLMSPIPMITEVHNHKGVSND